ncbi:MAG: hypothetical protein RSB82_01430 [Victivallaceae bacterium]
MTLSLSSVSPLKEFASRVSASWQQKDRSRKMVIALSISLVGISMISTALIGLVGLQGLAGNFSCSKIVYNFAWYLDTMCRALSFSSTCLTVFILVVGLIFLFIGLFLIPYKDVQHSQGPLEQIKKKYFMLK